MMRRALGLILVLAAPGWAAESLGPPLPTSSVVPAAAIAPPRPTPAAPVVDAYPGRPRLDVTLTPEEAAGLALRYSPVIAAMAEDVELARRMLALVRAANAVTLSAGAWGTVADADMVVPGAPNVDPAQSRILPGGGSLDAGLMAMYPLFTGGRLAAQSRAESQRLKAGEADLRALRLDLALQARTLARRLAAMAGMVDVEREAAETDAERLRNDRAAHAAGRVTLAAVLRDQAELAVARQQWANEVRDHHLMLADLRALLGVHPLSHLDILDPTVALPATTSESAAALPDPPPLPAGGEHATVSDAERADMDLAARQRPELAAARARLLGAGDDTRAAEAAFGPQVSLIGMADLFANRMNTGGRVGDYLVGAAVSLPLLDGGARREQTGQARAAQRKLSAQEQETALRVASEVSQAHAKLSAARGNLDTALTALAAAREDYRLMQLRYEAGMAVNAEVLDALRMRTMAAVNYLTAAHELAVARDERLRAVGDPTILNSKPPATP
jgi:outer membrane protein TolC